MRFMFLHRRGLGHWACTNYALFLPVCRWRRAAGGDRDAEGEPQRATKSCEAAAAAGKACCHTRAGAVAVSLHGLQLRRRPIPWTPTNPLLLRWWCLCQRRLRQLHVLAPPGSQKHIHFEQSDGDEPAASLAANGSLPQQPTQNKSTAHGAHSPAAALPAPAAVTPAPAAILPSPAASAPAALQRAVSANGSAPALRANTLAEVFAARGHATEAHANGRSSPHVGATSKQPDPDHLPQQNGFVHRQQKRRSVREPQVSHDQLPALQRPPQLGDVISYKLLEIGADYSPQVSKTSTQD